MCWYSENLILSGICCRASQKSVFGSKWYVEDSSRKSSFRKIFASKTFMMTDSLRKKILVLCDHDALYSAIEMKLSGLPQASIVRSALTLSELTTSLTLFEDVDLIILATVSPMADRVPALIDLLPSSQIGKPFVLIISEHHFVPELDDRITLLDFPFDMDGLPLTVTKMLDGDSSIGSLRSSGEKEV